MAEKILIIDGNNLTLEKLVTFAQNPGFKVDLSPEAWENVRRAERAVQDFIDKGLIVYGITTGFGAFKDKIIPPDMVARLQHNILMSHAVGVGEPMDAANTRAMMLIRANTLAKGHSGIRVETLRLLLDMLNRRVYPVVPSQGSLGASGDLAPLAHMALPLVGLGEVTYRGERLPAAEAFNKAGLTAVTLSAKEGLALTNGTAQMSAIGSLTTYHAENLAFIADMAGCLSLEALHGTRRAFDPRIHAARPHPRQVECAETLRRLIAESDFLRPDDSRNVQDAYSLRCIPQVHGAARDAIKYARWVLEIELNSATDNPLIFFDEMGGAPEVISGGNFHGEPIAIAMDYLSLALTELGNISERRLNRLTDEASNQETLPAFLIKHGGVNSGFMLTQYTAASLASENKVLAHPASADSIPSSANIEDHVSMGATAARQAEKIAHNLERILALEIFAAVQGIDFRRQRLGESARLGRGTSPAYRLVRSRVPFLEQDAVLYPHVETIREMIATGELRSAVESAIQSSE
jgi:histidine ammonia-lyase